MGTGIVLIVAEKVYAVLHSQELRDVCSMFGYESQLDDLKTTVFTIKSVLLDAESKHQELTHGGRDYIERLKEVVYNVDDLLDEFNTMNQKEKTKKGGKISKKVRRFFSRSNQFLVAYNMSHEIKSLRNKLDKIAKDRQQFGFSGFSDVYVPPKKREETISFATEDYVIGRETDKETIVGMLLGDLKSSNNVDYVTIVGIGGLGKTALAQLVYNDCRIEKAFDLQLWICVSDDFVLDKIFRQMLGKDGFTIEGLQREVRNLLRGKRYLLVLDDVWSENRDEWDKLKSFLNLGGTGSRVLVTSRSQKVASVVGDDHMYDLKGISDFNSWSLFKRLAFKQGKEPMKSGDDFFDVGKEIVKKCANVPLSIRVVGSMLYDQDESKWLSLKNANLMEIGQGDDGIMTILKYSYYHLTPALKTCFSYCSLFPKDYVIRKELLIRLWLAQGCLENSHDCRSEEDVGEVYFSILLHRCFLQDAKKDLYGEVKFCKMHDLIHDLAVKTAGKETIILDSRQDQFDKRCRHLSVTANGVYLLANNSTKLREMKLLRTFVTTDELFIENQSLFIDDQRLLASAGTAICQYLRRLRVLSFCGFDCENLPDTLGNLLQLRYLDVSWNRRLKVLPNSITKLINLLVLNLDETGVRELPRDMEKLINLRHLSLRRCYSLTHMPPGLDTLTSLHMLTDLVLGDETSNRGQIGKLRDLKALVNLRDELTIKFPDNFKYDVAEYKEVELLRLAPIKHLRIHFGCQGEVNHDTLLGCLQPNCSLSTISIVGYGGLQLPLWAESLTISLPHLVSIDLLNFDCLEILPSLSQLCYLKYLKLFGVSNVEFMQSDGVGIPVNNQLIFFPSLEELQLFELPKLKGWWRDETTNLVAAESSCASSLLVPSFPCLSKLVLRDCPNLTVFPSCPKLKSVELRECHEALTLLGRRTEVPCNPTTRFVLYLEELIIDDVGGHDCLFVNLLGSVQKLSIQHFLGETLSNIAAFVRIASLIEKLNIRYCNNLKSVSGPVEHLTSLQSLEISNCGNLELENSDSLTMVPWKSLHMLSYLSLFSLPKLLILPNGFQYLTSLVHLWIAFCENLEVLPEWLNCLTSLQFLSIWSCRKLRSLPEAIAHMPSLETLYLSRPHEDLRKRCRKPDGEDWPKICRIQHLILDNY